MYTPLPIFDSCLDGPEGRVRPWPCHASLSPAFGLTVVRTCSHGHDPEHQRNTNEQVQDDHIRHHLEIFPEGILLVIAHGKQEGQHLMGKHKSQGISDATTSFSSRPAGAAAGPGSHLPRGAAGMHRGAHGEAAAATPPRAALRGAGQPEALSPPGPDTDTDLLPAAAGTAPMPPRALPAHAPPTAARACPRLRSVEGALRLRPRLAQ